MGPSPQPRYADAMEQGKGHWIVRVGYSELVGRVSNVSMADNIAQEIAFSSDLENLSIERWRLAQVPQNASQRRRQED
jgi:hypothetical protein